MKRSWGQRMKVNQTTRRMKMPLRGRRDLNENITSDLKNLGEHR